MELTYRLQPGIGGTGLERGLLLYGARL